MTTFSIAIWGLEKTGKTHFSLTFPEPIYFFNFDFGLHRVLPKLKDKLIKVFDYDMSEGNFQELWKKFRVDYKKALEEATTIAIDTATQLWELVRLSYLDELSSEEKERQRLLPYEYAEPNSRFQSLIYRAKVAGKYLVLIHRARDEYVGDKSTGRKELAGFKDTKALVDMTLHFSLDGNVPIATFESCGFSLALNGLRVKNIDFKALETIISKVLEGI